MNKQNGFGKRAFSRAMALLLSLMLIFGALPFSAAADTTSWNGGRKIYLTPSIWMENNAVFSVLFASTKSFNTKKLLMTPVPNETGLYEAVVPDGDWQYINLYKYKTLDDAVNDKEIGNAISIYFSGTNNNFTVTVVNPLGSTHSRATGTWSTYVPKPHSVTLNGGEYGALKFNGTAVEGNSATFDVADGGKIPSGYTIAVADGYEQTGTTAVKTLDKKVIKVAAGGSLTVVQLEDGSVWACGGNRDGQLGDGTNTDRPYFVQMLGNDNKPITGVTEISAGYFHTVLLKNDGTVWSCGRNNFGQLGNGSNTNSNTLVQMLDSSKEPMKNIKSISAGDYHTIVLKEDGTAWGCGRNVSGLLGNGSNKNSNVFVPMTNATDIKAISAGGCHTVVLKNDGTVWGCGENYYGQLGTGTDSKSDILKLTSMANATGVSQIAAGDNNTVLLKNDGSVWVCGASQYGQLGFFAYVNEDSSDFNNSPVEVIAAGSITAVAAGSGHIVVLQGDGSVKAWGWNNGNLGNGTFDHSCTPVTMPGATDVTAITAGDSYTVVLKNDGSLMACGFNIYGNIGNGTTTNSKTLVKSDKMGVTAATLFSDLVITEETSITPTYERSVYSATFNANGGTGSMSASVNVGEAYTLPSSTLTPPTGYDFKCWKIGDTEYNVGASFTPTADFTVTAVWVAQKRIVSFEAGENGYGSMDAVEVDYGTSYTVPQCQFLSYNGYIFKRWKVGNTEYNVDDTIIITADTTITAVFEKLYTVSFANGGGSGTMSSVMAINGEVYTLPSCRFTPPANKVFAGWNVNGVIMNPNDTITVTADITITATYKWVTKTVSFASGDGTGSMSNVSKEYGSSYTLPANAFTAPEHKEFKCWSVGDTEKNPGDTITITADTTVTALYKYVSHTVTVDAGEGTGTAIKTSVQYNSTYTLPTFSFTVPEHKLFKCWSVGGEEKNPGEKITITADTQITAVYKWVKHTVSFNSGNGSGTMTSAEVDYGSTYTLTASTFTAPTGNEFDKWQLDGASYAIGAQITVTANITLKATYKKSVYTVSFVPGDGTGSMEAVSAEYGDTYTLPDCTFTAPTGYAFQYWVVGGENKQIGDKITITANTEISASYAKTKISGSCGTNLTYELIPYGSYYELRFTGTGDFKSYTTSTPPWNSYRNQIKTVRFGSGVANYYTGTFYTMSALETIIMTTDTISNDSSNFPSCTNVKTVKLIAKHDVTITTTGWKQNTVSSNMGKNIVFSEVEAADGIKVINETNGDILINGVTTETNLPLVGRDYTWAGTATCSDITIYTGRGLNYVATTLYSQTEMRGYTVYLANDITYSGVPIASKRGRAFSANFDGQNHTITLDMTSSDYTEYGLFAFDMLGKISNLKLAGQITNNNTSTTGYTGALSSSSFTLIRNCVSTATVSGHGYLGGLVGGFIGNGNIENCRADATFNPLSEGCVIGGIAGHVSCTNYIKNCYATYTLNGTAAAAYGIAGDFASYTGRGSSLFTGNSAISVENEYFTGIANISYNDAYTQMNEWIDAQTNKSDYTRWTKDPVKGDISGNGELGAEDLVDLRQKLLSGDASTTLCDLNGDGKADIKDLIRLKKMLAVM